MRGALVLVFLTAEAVAQRIEPAPKELQQVGVVEQLDAQIPLDTPFVDSSGRRVTLKDFFDGTLPVILTLNYSNCPMLCSLQLNGLLDGIQKMPWDLGNQYRIITVSIDPLETPERAALTKQKYMKLYARPGAEAGWHFLTSRSEADIKKVADTVGFHYTFDPTTRQYAHAAVIMICTPDGRVSRYLGGIEYHPQTLRLALSEASEGKVGSVFDQILLYCFHYDAEAGRYGPAAVKLMRVGGVLTLVVLGGMLVVLWRRDRRGSGRDGPSREPAGGGSR